jgi:dolichol-phosphate mannosyltransferase
MPAGAPEVAVVIPTYDEVDNVTPLIGRLRALPLNPRVVVVDDASPDGTADVVAAIAARDERVHLIRRPAKLGLGTAHRAGIELARKLGADLVTTMDADLSHPPERLAAVVAAAQRCGGMAIGSRYTRGGSSDYGNARQLVSRSANLAARLAIGGAPVRDATAGYRCYTRFALDRIQWDTLTSGGYSFLVEICAECRRGGVPIAEVPIHFTDRVAGVSKISRNEALRGIATLLRVIARRMSGRKHRSATTLARPGAGRSDRTP